MTIDRRTVAIGLATSATLGGCVTAQALPEATPMYGLIGKMLAQPGQRDALIAAMLEGTTNMPGCFSYIVARDPADENAIWITEVWDSAENHRASLQLPAVQATIARARPIIAGFGERFETAPVGGVGLAR